MDKVLHVQECNSVHGFLKMLLSVSCRTLELSIIFTAGSQGGDTAGAAIAFAGIQNGRGDLHEWK